MSTIGGLYLPRSNPFDLPRTTIQGINAAGGMVNHQTALLALADAQRQQDEAAATRAFLQQHPELVLGGGGAPQSVLASLAPAGGPPGGGPMTQQAFGAGQPPGAPQVVPGGQDLSRFATQGAPAAPPTSTLAALGPQPQAPHPQQRLLELARTNPEAALKVQQLMQGQQDAALKRDEQRLTMGTKVMEYVGRVAQGVTDQASLDAARAELARIHPQAAAQLPQTYSKEAMAPFIAKALDVKESMTLQVQDLQAQAAVIKARKEGRSTDVDNQLRAMGVQPGAETPAQMKEALQAVQEGKIAVSASHGTGQLKDTQHGVARIGKDNQVEYIRGPNGEILQAKPTQYEQETATFGNLAQRGHAGAVELELKGFKPGVLEKAADKLPFGMGNYLTSDEYQKYKDYVLDFAQAWLRKTSKGAITEDEWKLVDQRYFPQPGNSKAQIEQKRAAREAVIKEIEAEAKPTGRTGTQAPPTGGPAGGGAAAGAKVVTRAALHAEAQRRGVSPEQAEALARQKGYEVR